MKRFVSYLYSIYNNQKIHNSGFARIELRTGRNRIDIHLQEGGYSGKTGTVYLFVRKKKNIQGIPIGNIVFRNNQADFRYEQPDENIGQTSWQIMQMNGIVILMDDKITFLSQWDEEPVDTTQFEIWSKEKEERERNEQINAENDKQDLTEEKHNEQNNSHESNGRPDHEQPVKNNGNNMHTNHDKKNETSEYDFDRVSSNNSENNVQSGQKTENEKEHGAVKQSREAGIKNLHTNPGISLQADYIRAKNPSQGNRNNTQINNGAGRFPNPLPVQNVQDAVNAMQQNQNMSQIQNGQQGPVMQENIPRNQKKSQHLEGQDEENISGQQVSNIHTAEIQPQPGFHQWEQTWRYMLRIYPVLNQFADKDNVLCVRIEIKDVRLLPEKYWSVVNNSFLLHGFFNYRYLIFGRIGQNWMIGIPGIYQNQEHAMASIFGFPDFLAQEHKNERGEQPGYWYRILEI